jgi:sugar fermentation stimulation protein A
MRLPTLIPGAFVARDNRFRATVLVGGAPVAAHVPTSGRMRELLLPGRTVWLSPQPRPGRKTPYDLVLVEHEGALVSIDSRLPNALMAERLRRQGWEGRPLRSLTREVPLGASRLDLLLEDEAGVVWMEVKSVTLVVGGLALFPDAPTTRGVRHLEELIAVAARGGRAAVAFVAQRADALRFAPHREADPAFAQTLAEAARAGVLIRAYACEVSRQEIAIARTIPVALP